MKYYCSTLLLLFVQITFSQKNMEAYLFAYFEGSGEAELQEQLRFAVSPDAKTWKALNNNQPILNSSRISNTGGIRDPHILRSNDRFYMVATDMFTVKNGWDENPGIILMHSDNLIEWEATAIDFRQIYPEKFEDVQWVWAPQTFYDKEKDKYLIYFTIRFKGQENLDFYSAYANEDFSGFENEPELMFRAKYGAIDGDIIYKDGIYHLFYKGNTKDQKGKEFKNGIQQAISRSLDGPWKEDFEYLDAYANSKINVEGSSVFKLNDSEEYILMYDLYSSGKYEFQRSKDLFNFSEETESFTKDFHPRHGSVIGITSKEAKRLNDKWGGVPKTLLK
ncbi:glycoside hydrolase family 43 protein [Zunongwangia endophytica]|uniref:Glycoside hydrolase family 43 protein n=1 Tax=Zunongwangia endophytica TaxID=1808945 RepID=A0ABV8HE38_9FLAO|nr:glycoside hydrolase family 43 protein [Zunongwangia endophytica]MDN3596728.1 glycoside hydrolase family 43 protein [Zunongwangia endophytica]